MTEPADNSDGTVRSIGRPFQPGQSGNPGGRPKGVARTVREVCGGSPLRLAQGLLQIAEDPKAHDRDRVAAYRELLDRGWGKAPAFAAVDGADPLEVDGLMAEAMRLVAEIAASRAS
jgi:Family of unknown function (DUF5681)